jgi:hypothetical protein
MTSSGQTDSPAKETGASAGKVDEKRHNETATGTSTLRTEVGAVTD